MTNAQRQVALDLCNEFRDGLTELERKAERLARLAVEEEYYDHWAGLKNDVSSLRDDLAAIEGDAIRYYREPRAGLAVTA